MAKAKSKPVVAGRGLLVKRIRRAGNRFHKRMDAHPKMMGEVQAAVDQLEAAFDKLDKAIASRSTPASRSKKKEAAE